MPRKAAQATFDLVDSLEARLSRLRSNSDIARIAEIAPGEKMRLSEPRLLCLSADCAGTDGAGDTPRILRDSRGPAKSGLSSAVEFVAVRSKQFFA